MKTAIRSFGLVIALLALGSKTVHLAGQGISTPAILHSFSAPVANPRAGLTLGADGAMYGTTESGGASRFGTIYRFTLNNDFSVVASFTGTNGGSPTVPLVLGTNGLLYGVAPGGDNTAQGILSVHGVVFRWGPGGVEKLVDFGGLAANVLRNSYDPGALILNPNDGSFYGICQNGAFGGPVTSSGSVFAMSHSGVVRLLHSFATVEDGFGYGPNSLLLGKDGLMYGSTRGGGSNGVGMVFSITTGGVIQQVYQASTNSGESPRLYLQGSDGALYGNTLFGPRHAPTHFKLTTNGMFTTLGDLNEIPSGHEHVVAEIIETPLGIYGVTTGGFGNAGSVFRIGADGKVIVLHRFQLGSTNGVGPRGLLLASNGALYGTTVSGGMAGDGAIFRTSAFPLQITSSRSAGFPALNWAGVSGLTYQVSIHSNLIASNWVTLTNVLATNSTPSFVDRSISNSPLRFYKLAVP